MPGTDARMRVSSVILRASSCGTLRSARMNTRWLRTSMSLQAEDAHGAARAHFAFTSATVVSSMRLLKPHSLSYHAETFTSRPETFVSVASNVDDAGS